MSRMLTVALPKGRLLGPSLERFASVGCQVTPESFAQRKLFVEDEQSQLRFITVKPWDVPVYVEYGIADVGIAGGDVLAERGSDVFVPRALGFGACRMVVAAREDADAVSNGNTLVVATKYPQIASQWFAEHGQPVEIVTLQGSVELAPVLELAGRIVDLVETGSTLKANGLVVETDIAHYEAQLVVCRSSLLAQTVRIQELIAAVGDGGS